MTPPGKPHGVPTIAIAFLIAFLMISGLIVIIAAIIPGVLLMVVAGLGLIMTFAAQYFLWARWLYPIVVRMEQRAEQIALPQPSDSAPGTAPETVR